MVYAGGNIESSSKAESRRQELEADMFAGFIMSKLGYDLQSAIAPFERISSDEDDTYSTHPSRDKRISAVKKGFKKAGGAIAESRSSNESESRSNNESSNWYFKSEYGNDLSGRFVTTNKEAFTIFNFADTKTRERRTIPFEKIKVLEKLKISWYKIEIDGDVRYALVYDIHSLVF